jgi:hypothetical protein
VGLIARETVRWVLSRDERIRRATVGWAHRRRAHRAGDCEVSDGEASTSRGQPRGEHGEAKASGGQPFDQFVEASFIVRETVRWMRRDEFHRAGNCTVAAPRIWHVSKATGERRAIEDTVHALGNRGVNASKTETFCVAKSQEGDVAGTTHRAGNCKVGAPRRADPRATKG